jgi:penicillin-binding protein 1A
MALPIWRQFAVEALRGQAPTPFIAPPGIRMVRVERRSGRRVFGSFPGTDRNSAVIWEAFKPETEPRRTIRQDELPEQPQRQVRRRATTDTPRESQTRQPRENDFIERQGGIY